MMNVLEAIAVMIGEGITPEGVTFALIEAAYHAGYIDVGDAAVAILAARAAKREKEVTA